MGGARNRQKGHEWEREAARELTKATGVRWTRVLDETREGNKRGDLESEDGVLPGTFQCKRGKRPNVWTALDEAVLAEKSGGGDFPPVGLVYRDGSRHVPTRRVAIMEFDDWLTLYLAWISQGRRGRRP